MTVIGTLSTVNYPMDTVNLCQVGKDQGCGNVDEHCAEGNQHV